MDALMTQALDMVELAQNENRMIREQADAIIKEDQELIRRQAIIIDDVSKIALKNQNLAKDAHNRERNSKREIKYCSIGAGIGVGIACFISLFTPFGIPAAITFAVCGAMEGYAAKHIADEVSRRNI